MAKGAGPLYIAPPRPYPSSLNASELGGSVSMTASDPRGYKLRSMRQWDSEAEINLGVEASATESRGCKLAAGWSTRRLSASHNLTPKLPQTASKEKDTSLGILCQVKFDHASPRFQPDRPTSP